MAADEETDRSTVTTYLPEYQKQAWADHADDLGMSQAEYVRTMVQAGRKGFELDSENSDLEGPSGPSNPRGNALETRVLDAFNSAETLSWETLVDTLSTDFEDRLEETLESLQEQNRIRYSGRDGGYRLVEQ